ncbi:MAG TPA: tetratricopeptide repeat protein [Caulobacteraceae bacterium]|nr:tetratricopeptide repeat protein [Caulobacteraceae bacterium]
MPTPQALPASAVLREALSRHRAGERDAAETAYRLVLQAEPGHALANHNLGVLLLQAGRMGEALDRLRRALLAEPNAALHWFSYAKGLMAARAPGRARGVLAEAETLGLADQRFDPLRAEIATDGSAVVEAEDAALLNAAGNVFLAQGRTEDAIVRYRAALDIAPDFAEAHYRLGSVLSENGRVPEGFAHYMRRAELAHGAAPADPASDPPHKARHDEAQRAHLAARGIAAAFHLAEGDRLAGPAVDPANATPTLFDAWRRAAPQMAVIDGFLSPEALRSLRAYCADSTVWRKVYAAGYLGAAPEDGFACPLLAQIVEEVQQVYRPILAGLRFRYLGAFKYDSETCGGTNTHGDNCAINVNLYITPDDANLDPDHGGMLIWNRPAADLAELRRYNADEPALNAMLEREGAPVTVVPHRANRAVIFRSSLFHRTDRFAFRPDYLSRRINVSLLFGDLD